MKGPKTIEIAGKRILAMPLETMGLTREQQNEYEAAGGLMNPPPEIAKRVENQDKMMYWTESFETLQSEIDGILYKDFDLFKKVYEAFPDIASMTKDEAIEAGLYPIIHYRNYAARKWMAEMLWGRLATLDRKYWGELSDIYHVAPWRTSLQKLAAIGQAPLGWYDVDLGDVFGLGFLAVLGSESIDPEAIDENSIRALEVFIDQLAPYAEAHLQIHAVSSVVVFDNENL